MTKKNDAAEKIALMAKQIRSLQIFTCLLLTFGATAILILSMRPVTAKAADGVLRVRGLIIEDASGRERILIGAPIPAAANRVRTDETRARESWAGRYPDPDRYMGFYKGYNHETNGILILDDHGFDRIALGDPVPDPNVGKRIGPSTGMIINDERGNERSGYGLLKVGDRYRVVLGLDSAQGREGLTLGLSDEGEVGMTVRDAKGAARTGADGVHVLAGSNDGKPIQ